MIGIQTFNGFIEFFPYNSFTEIYNKEYKIVYQTKLRDLKKNRECGA